MQLNPQQTAAVQYLNGPLLVLAGAGSGKTRVIIQKIYHLIKYCNYKPTSVVAVTFTNKTANEMRHRVAGLIPKQIRRGLTIATFHMLGLSILKRHANACELRTGFSIFDTDDCSRLLRNLLPTTQAGDSDFLRQTLQKFSRWKNDLLTLDAILAQEHDELTVALYTRYLQTLKAYNAVDFDDLIRLPVELLKTESTILDYWQNKIRYLLIDEYQDSNTSQYQLVKLLTAKNAQFTVVGDDDQSIYAWRGARPENLVQLQHDYPLLKVIKLEQNYRSTGTILHVANTLIANNDHLFPKKLWSELGHGEVLRVLSCKDENDEAEQVISDIISHKLHYNTCYGDYAILYRGNYQARVFERILRHHSIAYHQSGGQSWFSKTEVKDILAYLKLLSNESDDAAFLRVINLPKRGIGEASLETLGNYAKTRTLPLYTCAHHLALTAVLGDKPRAILLGFKNWLESIKQRLVAEPENLVEILRSLIDCSGYEPYIYESCDNSAAALRRMENVWDLIDWIGRLNAREPANCLSDVINKLILIEILEQSDSEHDKEQIQLLTLHAAKGLEFPYVYLVGMEEELLPHRVSIAEENIAEERRLAYVGITRAQKRLCLTLAKQRRKNGELQDCQPSRFLDELPQNSLEWFGKGQERSPEKVLATAQTHLAGLRSLLQS